MTPRNASGWRRWISDRGVGADGRLMVQGFEADGPATEILELTA